MLPAMAMGENENDSRGQRRKIEIEGTASIFVPPRLLKEYNLQLETDKYESEVDN